MIDCWIHLDEVGNFHKSALGRSLIGGWFSFTRPTEEQTLKMLQWALGYQSDGGVRYHAVHHKAAVEGHLERVLPLMGDVSWQPVVFSVQQEAYLGHPIPTYMHAMADGLFTLARHLTRTQGEGVRLHVVAASWSSAGEDEYRRIKERLALERLRRTWTRNDLPVDIEVDLGDAREHHGLMIADMIMYGLTHLESYGDQVRDLLLEALGPFLFNVLASEDEQRLDDLLTRRDYGQAVIEVLALRGIGKHETDIEEKLAAELRCIGNQPYTLEAAFEAVGNRIEFEVAERNLDFAERQLEGWLDLLARLDAQEGVDPQGTARARVRALELRLRCSNHRGAVEEAERILQRLRPACDALGVQLESLPLVLDVRSLDGVHRTNCYNFEVWTDLLDVAEGVVELHDAMRRLRGGQERVRSAFRGRLLGTALQACTKAARRNPALIDAAREISESAQEEFTRIEDLRRQHGYRCELETDAGNLDEAAQWLRVAAGFQPDLPLREVIARIAAEDKLGFNLTHAVRLWAAYERRASSDDSVRETADLFMKSFTTSVCARLEIQMSADHPWPMTAWMVGRAIGLRPKGDPSLAGRYIATALPRLDENPAHLTLLSLSLGARCDLLALQVLHPRLETQPRLWETTIALAERLAGCSIATLARWFADWPDRLRAMHAQVSSGDSAAGRLREMSLEIPY